MSHDRQHMTLSQLDPEDPFMPMGCCWVKCYDNKMVKLPGCSPYRSAPMRLTKKNYETLGTLSMYISSGQLIIPDRRQPDLPKSVSFHQHRSSQRVCTVGRHSTRAEVGGGSFPGLEFRLKGQVRVVQVLVGFGQHLVQLLDSPEESAVLVLVLGLVRLKWPVGQTGPVVGLQQQRLVVCQ